MPNGKMTVKADGTGWGLRVRRLFKRLKNRAERRASKLDPETPPGYGRYRGYLT